jgi:hypothetical protein
MTVSTPPAPAGPAIQHEPVASPQPGAPRSRRGLVAAVVVAGVAVIGLLGGIAAWDRDGSTPPAVATAETQDQTAAQLSEMWASADAGFAGLEPVTATAAAPAPAAAEPDAALWASADAASIVPNQ